MGGVSGRRDGLAWIMVGETLRVRSAEFEASTSIRVDVDVNGTVKIVFLYLLSHQQKKPNPRRASSFMFFTTCDDRQGALIERQHQQRA